MNGDQGIILEMPFIVDWSVRFVRGQKHFMTGSTDKIPASGTQVWGFESRHDLCGRDIWTLRLTRGRGAAE